jgi:hypothetical protein
LSQAKEEIIVAEPVSDAESDDDRRIKRQLPSTVTPERVSTKKIHKTEGENEHSKKKSGGNPDKTCRKTLFSENPKALTRLKQQHRPTKRPCRTTNLSTVFVTLNQYVTRKALK